jgi:hypothetical protein
MPRKSRAQQFAALEDESIRSQIPGKVLPLIEQLVFERSVEVNAALTFRMKLLEIRVADLERRLEKLDPQPREGVDPWKYYDPHSGRDEEPTQDAGEDLDEDSDEEIPF